MATENSDVGSGIIEVYVNNEYKFKWSKEDLLGDPFQTVRDLYNEFKEFFDRDGLISILSDSNPIDQDYIYQIPDQLDTPIEFDPARWNWTDANAKLYINIEEEYICEHCGKREFFSTHQDALDDYWSSRWTDHGILCDQCDNWMEDHNRSDNEDEDEDEYQIMNRYMNYSLVFDKKINRPATLTVYPKSVGLHLEPLDGHEVVITSCGHVFEFNELETWLNHILQSRGPSELSCPDCRHKLGAVDGLQVRVVLYTAEKKTRLPYRRSGRIAKRQRTDIYARDDDGNIIYHVQNVPKLKF